MKPEAVPTFRLHDWFRADSLFGGLAAGRLEGATSVGARLCRQLADAMGLERVDPQAGHSGDSSPFSLFDGTRCAAVAAGVAARDATSVKIDSNQLQCLRGMLTPLRSKVMLCTSAQHMWLGQVRVQPVHVDGRQPLADVHAVRHCAPAVPGAPRPHVQQALPAHLRPAAEWHSVPDARGAAAARRAVWPHAAQPATRLGGETQRHGARCTAGRCLLSSVKRHSSVQLGVCSVSQTVCVLPSLDRRAWATMRTCTALRRSSSGL
jgi:hypothetical protein